MRTVGTLAPGRGGSMKVARKPKSVGHFFGFLAVAAFPSTPSIRAYARSPTRPRSVTSVPLSSSPSIDLTGYRHNEATEPCVALGMLASSSYFGAVCALYTCRPRPDATIVAARRSALRRRSFLRRHGIVGDLQRQRLPPLAG